MTAATVPAVYASALLELSQDNQRRAEVVADAAAVAEVFDGNPQLLQALRSPKLSREQGKALLGSVFGPVVGQEVMDFLRLTVDRDRVEEVPAILSELARQAAEQDGRRLITVTSAIALEANNRARLEAMLRDQQGTNIEITYQVDPAIIGGLRIQSPGRVVDFTASRHLAEMKRSMLAAPVAAAWDDVG